eukprot:Phypoly_transcript_04723.p1 GENE.Phypoly_transcript_04723~~Phypoly_transcript_04723.p1  ORF type:complete len:555 (+),score=73.64 Phypoly_transcript_04723:88-1752(+)
MGNGLGKDKDEKKKVQVNKSNSYPQPAKRGRRSTVDGALSHLNLEVEPGKRKEKGGGKFGTGTFTKDIKLQQQLASLQLGETLGNRPGRKHRPSQTENGRDGSDTETTPRKRASRLNFLQNSLKRKQSFSPPTPPTHAPPYDTSFDDARTYGNNTPTKVSPSREPSYSYVNDELSQSKATLSEESDYMSSSVSSLSLEKDSFRRENSYGFVDPDNVVGNSETIQKIPHRPRGRSVSDSLFTDNYRESSLSEMQKAAENEKKKTRRFQELTKVLAERKNVIIELHDLVFVRKVGEGAFSEVWEGYWNGVHVAIKKLKSMVDDELFQERFLREIESLRKGNHQNVVMFFGVCLRPACIITEFMAGGNLYDLLHKTGMRMSTSLVVKLALDLAVGLLHLHSLTILHRDLTSLNILLDEMGNIKISDFGLSREKTQDGSMTMTIGGICNPRWRPPEITKNIGHYSEKVDVYSFALVVWEILTGELPFSNLDGPQAAAQAAYTTLRPEIPATCPAPLRNLIQRCWADDAKLRPEFREIVDELRAIQYNNPMGYASETFR